MLRDTSEPLAPGAPYPPNVELFGMVGTIEPEPLDFRSTFARECGDVYAGDPLERLKASDYDPVILGYTHGNPAELGAIEKKVEELKAGSDHTLVMLQEIDPQQLQWVEDFLAMEARFKVDGTVNGHPARPDEAQRMAAYRRQLGSNHAEALSLWCLDNGIDVRSIEHPQVKQWIAEATSRYAGDEEWDPFGLQTPREFYTAIRRDAHGLELIDAERPDIVSVGFMHALKYDALLERDGQQTFYYLSAPVRWQAILRHWVDSHKTAHPR